MDIKQAKGLQSQAGAKETVVFELSMIESLLLGTTADDSFLPKATILTLYYQSGEQHTVQSPVELRWRRERSSEKEMVQDALHPLASCQPVLFDVHLGGTMCSHSHEIRFARSDGRHRLRGVDGVLILTAAFADSVVSSAETAPCL